MDAWNKVAIVGVGLIGGSVGMAVRQRGLARQVIGISTDEASLRVAEQRGAIDEGSTILARGADGAELIVVCTPVDSIASVVNQAAECLSAGGCITDVGSTKQTILNDVAPHVPFVGGHPMAGSEKSGPEFAREDLFVDRKTILTPTADSSPEDVSRIRSFWEALGANVVEMSGSDHDDLVATVSHLPHVVASVLAGITNESQWPHASTGWADTTRVAAGAPELWTSILMDNRSHLLQAIKRYTQHLEKVRIALENHDKGELTEHLQTGKNHRDALGS